MGKVLGVGGVFFKAADPDAVRAWYKNVLGFEPESWGGVLFPPRPSGDTVWNAFDATTTYFDPSTRGVMINFLVEDLDGLLERAAAAGVTPLGRDDSDPHGRFAWFLDPAGFKIELWESKVSEADEAGS